MCRSKLGSRTVGNPDIPHPIKEEYQALIRRLLDYALDRESPEYEVTLTDDGRAVYHDYDIRMEPNLAVSGSFAHMTEWGTKLVGQLLRIAGIIAVCEGRGDIDEDIARRAVALSDWYAANAMLLVTKPSVQKRVRRRESNSDYLLNVINKADGEISVREAKRRTQNKTNFDLEEALLELETDGEVEIIERNQSKIIVISRKNNSDSSDTPI